MCAHRSSRALPRSLARAAPRAGQRQEAAMATVDRFTYSKAPVKKVAAVQFSVWDPDEIVSAVCFGGSCSAAALPVAR